MDSAPIWSHSDINVTLTGSDHLCLSIPATQNAAGDKELVGTLRGFDVFVNMVLEQVEAYEATPEGTRVTKLDQILLNGNNIAILVPGGKPEE